MTARDIALKNEILRGVVGSTALGTAIDGQDDRDEMGIFIEPPNAVCGLSSVDHYIYRDAGEGERSKPGDLDLTLYSLRKYCRLAAAGNPSILILLWLPQYMVMTPLGLELVSIRDAFVSREAGKRFRGFMLSQRASLVGERNKSVKQPDLVEAYGFDTKFAMHALRLGLQGLEFLSNGKLTLPMFPPTRLLLRKIRTGEVPLAKVIEMIDDTAELLEARIAACTRTADIKRIEEFMVNAHRRWWE